MSINFIIICWNSFFDLQIFIHSTLTGLKGLYTSTGIISNITLDLPCYEQLKTIVNSSTEFYYIMYTYSFEYFSHIELIVTSVLLSSNYM